MVTYAKRPAQSERLEQPSQKRQRTRTARSIGQTIGAGVDMGTTLTPNGEILPTIRRSFAEQSSGSAGKSSDKQATSNTSGTETSGKLCNTIPSQVLQHGKAQSPAASSLSVGGAVNIHKSRPNAFSIRTCALIWSAAIVVTWGIIAALVLR